MIQTSSELHRALAPPRIFLYREILKTSGYKLYLGKCHLGGTTRGNIPLFLILEVTSRIAIHPTDHLELLQSDIDRNLVRVKMNAVKLNIRWYYKFVSVRR